MEIRNPIEEQEKQKMIEEACSHLWKWDEDDCIRFFEKRAEEEPKPPTPDEE